MHVFAFARRPKFPSATRWEIFSQFNNSPLGTALVIPVPLRIEFLPFSFPLSFSEVPLAEKPTERYRVAILDDYEGLADHAEAYETLKQRTEVHIYHQKLDSDADFKNALAGIHAVLLMRERTRFGEKQLALAPALKLISQTGRPTRSEEHTSEIQTRFGIT